MPPPQEIIGLNSCWTLGTPQSSLPVAQLCIAFQVWSSWLRSPSHPHPTPLFTPSLSCHPVAHLTDCASPILLPRLSKGTGCESQLPSYAWKQEEGGRWPLTWLWPFPLGEPLLSSRARNLMEQRFNHSLSSEHLLLVFPQTQDALPLLWVSLENFDRAPTWTWQTFLCWKLLVSELGKQGKGDGQPFSLHPRHRVQTEFQCGWVLFPLRNPKTNIWPEVEEKCS